MGPSSFLKLKLLGKGDVGRVYLVREKKTDKLFAMKGKAPEFILERPPTPIAYAPTIALYYDASQRGAQNAYLTLIRSVIEERND